MAKYEVIVEVRPIFGTEYAAVIEADSEEAAFNAVRTDPAVFVNLGEVAGKMDWEYDVAFVTPLNESEKEAE